MVTPAPKECHCGGFRFKNYTTDAGTVVPDKLVCQECGLIWVLTKPYWIEFSKYIGLTKAVENKRHHDEDEIWKGVE